MSAPRLRRLAADYESVRAEFSGHPHVHIEPLGPQRPPEAYRVTFRVRGLRLDGNQPVAVDEHQVEIRLPLGYPREKPLCYALTPVFHPNIKDAVLHPGLLGRRAVAGRHDREDRRHDPVPGLQPGQPAERARRALDRAERAAVAARERDARRRRRCRSRSVQPRGRRRPSIAEPVDGRRPAATARAAADPAADARRGGDEAELVVSLRRSAMMEGTTAASSSSPSTRTTRRQPPPAPAPTAPPHGAGAAGRSGLSRPSTAPDAPAGARSAASGRRSRRRHRAAPARRAGPEPRQRPGAQPDRRHGRHPVGWAITEIFGFAGASAGVARANSTSTPRCSSACWASASRSIYAGWEHIQARNPEGLLDALKRAGPVGAGLGFVSGFLASVHLHGDAPRRRCSSPAMPAR